MLRRFICALVGATLSATAVKVVSDILEAEKQDSTIDLNEEANKKKNEGEVEE